MHLTLVFMGDVSVDGLERVVEVGDWAAASFDAFQVTLGSTDCFPTPSNPRVLFVHADSEKLIPLAARLQKGLEQWADPKPFRPHLTIARRKVEAASFQKMRFTHSWPVDRFDLMKSTLGGGPAEHSVVMAFSLRNP